MDLVVVGKALVSMLALALAFLAAQSSQVHRRRLGTGSWWVLAALLGSSALGALAYGTLLPSGVLVVRVAILAATIFFLLRAYDGMRVLHAIVGACGSIALVAAVTGLPSAGSGRLEGRIPPLNPNELALLASVVVLFVAWRTVMGEARWANAAVGVAGLAVVWATGSRTGLLMLVAALVVMTLHLRRARIGLVVGGLVLIAISAVAMESTGAVSRFLQRDGVGASTLESRFIAWGAARSWAETTWQHVLGGGLSVKLIPVDGQWWNEQLLDSSWVSALVQTGAFGLLVCLVWVGWSVTGVRRAPRPHRVLFTGLLTFLLGRSILESGLFDATPSFLLFFAVSLLVEDGSRARLQEELDTVGLDSTHPTGASGRAAAAESSRA